MGNKSGNRYVTSESQQKGQLQSVRRQDRIRTLLAARDDMRISSKRSQTMSPNLHQRHVAALAVALASVFAAVAPGETPTTRHTVEITGDWRFQMDAPDIGEKENW